MLDAKGGSDVRSLRPLDRWLATLFLLTLVGSSSAFGQVLWDNGPLITASGTGIGGADESVLQDTTLGDGELGYLNGGAPFFERIADDFTVPGGESWTISSVVFYAYQTGTGTTSTITGVNLQIWDGPPNVMGSSVVFGDDSTNRLSSTVWSGIYRVAESSGSDSDRPIMTNTVTVGTTLGPGTYWLDWQTEASLPNDGPWAPPVTEPGVGDTARDATPILFNGVSWVAVTDTSGPKGLPFLIVGGAPSTAIPTASEWGHVVLILLLGAFAWRRLTA